MLYGDLLPLMLPYQLYDAAGGGGRARGHSGRQEGAHRRQGGAPRLLQKKYNTLNLRSDLFILNSISSTHTVSMLALANIQSWLWKTGWLDLMHSTQVINDADSKKFRKHFVVWI